MNLFANVPSLSRRNFEYQKNDVAYNMLSLGWSKSTCNIIYAIQREINISKVTINFNIKNNTVILKKK